MAILPFRFFMLGEKLERGLCPRSKWMRSLPATPSARGFESQETKASKPRLPQSQETKALLRNDNKNTRTGHVFCGF